MSELKAIEEINEEIKDIAAVTESISLTAAEAMREATQAGISSAGFSLVTRELRVFSEKMTSAMQRLSGLIEWQVEVNAGKHRPAPGRDFPAVAYMDGQADMDEIELLIVDQVCELHIGMMRTAKQCGTALIIARSVDMEAARGVAMTPELLLITQNVEEVVGNIAIRIRRLESLLAKAGLWKKNRIFGNPVGSGGLIDEDAAELQADTSR